MALLIAATTMLITSMAATNALAANTKVIINCNVPQTALASGHHSSSKTITINCSSSGVKGEKGDKGDKGDSIVGPAGKNGLNGTNGSNSTVPGPKGDKGDTGANGTTTVIFCNNNSTNPECNNPQPAPLPPVTNSTGNGTNPTPMPPIVPTNSTNTNSTNSTG